MGFVVTLWDRWSSIEMTATRETCWFEEKVLGLGRMLDLAKPASFRRYRSTFEENLKLAQACVAAMLAAGK